MVFMVAIYLLTNNKSTKYFILNDKEIKFLNQKYEIDQVGYCEYCNVNGTPYQ